jgi:hypothetical protein
MNLRAQARCAGTAADERSTCPGCGVVDALAPVACSKPVTIGWIIGQDLADAARGACPGRTDQQDRPISGTVARILLNFMRPDRISRRPEKDA